MKPFLLATLAAAGIAVSACSPGASPAGPARSGPDSLASASPASASPTNGSSGAAAANQGTASPAPGQPAAAPGCIGRYLNITATTAGTTAGTQSVTLAFRNLYTTCTLQGYPGVAQAAGQPPQDVGQPSTEDPATPRELVTLQPGGYAHATLKIADAGNFPPSQCTPVSSQLLNVIPPNTDAPLPVSFTSTACNGSAQLLTVTAVRPGSGS